MPKTIIIIPTRLSAKRLPKKPLLKINDIPMIIHCYKRAEEANIGDVYIATPDKEIIEVAKNFKCKSIFTGNEHLTGTDRVYEAYKKINDREIDMIINLQGDMPNIISDNILKLNYLMRKTNSEIGTLAAETINNNELVDCNIVKVKLKDSLDRNNFSKAEDFFRKNDLNDSINIYHHIGIYAFKPQTLKKFITLNRSKNEIERNLEQMRALDAGIVIKVALTSAMPLSVDTQEELEKVRSLMSLKK